METTWNDIKEPFYSAKKIDDILILSFAKQPFVYMLDLNVKQDLLDIMDKANQCCEIKVILIRESTDKMTAEEYVVFFDEMINTGGYEQLHLERLCNGVNQFLLKLASLDKIVIHTDGGNVIHFFMNTGLVCDYRIVTDNTVFKNPSIDIGVVPKGAGAYFLPKMIGKTAAAKILLSKDGLSAAEAYKIGLVDEVVPIQDFEQKAWEAAQRAARLPHLYAVGIKRLLNHDTTDLQQYLELENKLLRQQVQSYRKTRNYTEATAVASN